MCEERQYRARAIETERVRFIRADGSHGSGELVARTLGGSIVWDALRGEHVNAPKAWPVEQREAEQ